MSDQPDVTPEDALDVARRALTVANENRDLEQRVADLEEDITALKLRYGELDENRDYEEMTRDEKIGKVREHAFQQAVDAHCRAALDYHDIKWTVFDGEPSPAQCYDLMKWATSSRGFEHAKPDEGNERLTVNADEARRGLAFYSAKKDAAEEVS